MNKQYGNIKIKFCFLYLCPLAQLNNRADDLITAVTTERRKRKLAAMFELDGLSEVEAEAQAGLQAGPQSSKSKDSRRLDTGCENTQTKDDGVSTVDGGPTQRSKHVGGHSKKEGGRQLGEEAEALLKKVTLLL